MTSDELHILDQAALSLVHGVGYPQQLGMMELVENGYLRPICCGNVRITQKGLNAISHRPLPEQ